MGIVHTAFVTRQIFAETFAHVIAKKEIMVTVLMMVAVTNHMKEHSHAWSIARNLDMDIVPVDSAQLILMKEAFSVLFTALQSFMNTVRMLVVQVMFVHKVLSGEFVIIIAQRPVMDIAVFSSVTNLRMLAFALNIVQHLDTVIARREIVVTRLIQEQADASVTVSEYCLCF